MSIVKYLAKFAELKIQKLTTQEQQIVWRNRDVPQKLWQGSIIDMEITTRILAEAAGSIIPEIPNNQTILAVGKLKAWTNTIYRSYLSDQRSFIESTVSMDNTIEPTLRLYTLERNEQYSSNPEDWEGLLDHKEGVLGWEQFQVNRESGDITFNRMWGEGQRYAPWEFTKYNGVMTQVTKVPEDEIDGISFEPTVETLEDGSGKLTRYNHLMMQYGRVLTDNINEYLIPQVTDESAFNLWIGIDILPSSFTIIPGR